ncbi:hypothetical protein Ahy_B02g058974 [Arachis hypogaea]|uniref:Uncharacterized protein n=1 Tax=Arachis hypogaea TaxID=3818 RepID=A0A445AFU9_ARAHY|nr:hypothetical protein Ahy_B02g058974 [Arachis hypogaea]
MDAKHNFMIRKIYDHQTAKHFQQMMSNIRPAVKKDLEAYFTHDEEFKHHCLTNVANRASPRSSKYTGGSATFMKTKSRLFKLLDREATLVETFKYTHTLKVNNERFAEEQSAAHYEDYMHRLEVVTQKSQPPSRNDDASSETSVVDPDRIWLGSFSASGLLSFALATSSVSASATSSANPQEVIDLMEEVQKLTQELH